MKPLVYVITINYNSAQHTVEMVNNLVESYYDNLKIIVVDNCSEQNDLDKLKEITDRATIIRSETNTGFAGGNNLGIKLAMDEDADYVLLLNNDTVVEKNAISILVSKLEEGNASVACPKILNYYDRRIINYAGGDIVSYKGAVRIDGIGQVDNGIFNKERNVTFAHGCCMLIAADTIRKVGYMTEDYFLYFEDTDYSARLTRQGEKIIYCPDAVIYHKESVSTDKFSDNYQFYFCRNRMLFTKRNIALSVKYVAYLYSLMYMIKHLAKGDFKLQNITDALKAFVSNNTGKR